jgi:phage minor structural protein
LYKKILNKNGNEIKPGDANIEGIITKNYNLFNAAYVEKIAGEDIKKVDDAEKIEYDTVLETAFNYDTYVPVYNTGAQKVRSITAKESNYFNILQSIAETFEAWLELEIVRNDTGAIDSKTAKFKNYSGGNNYAAFRYGVNLKDIQRTYASKDIVTKLVVK